MKNHPLTHAPHPKKSLGQNWLQDELYFDPIIAAAELTATDTVLEIGPGPGNLTRRLAVQAGRVIAVELDDRLITPLRQHFADQPQVEIVHGDILDLNPAALVRERQGDKVTGRQGDKANQLQDEHPPPATRHPPPLYKVVANLPYYITSAVLRHLLEASPPPTLAVVMVQAEVAERICAGPGEMSLLAVSVQFYARPQIVQRVPASAFYPRPKVDSAVVRLDVFAKPLLAGIDPTHFFTLVRAGFSQKRKQLHNTLSTALALRKDNVVEMLTKAGIDSTRRAETLSLTEWGQLYHTWQAQILHPPENL